ncbi:MAG: SprB repeat-containing protein [Deltaproteobacteria bacterium]|jgi:hypothetical protein|nr:SprB repeat-containing protein [Deltaproteobacteria bacterium]MBW2481839.1 SprB repeat-containing protein [Deltaproteobacteria bacterium]
MKKSLILPAVISVVLLLAVAESGAFCPVSFFPGDVACDAQGEFGWIGPYHQGATVSPNSQINVSVTGGCPPYTWSLSGSGYWLVNDFTYNEDNTVYTDSDIACSATISVLDRYGSQLTGYLRAPGKWTLINQGVCELSGLPTSSSHNSSRHEDYIIVGNKKQVQRIGIPWKSGGTCRTPRPQVNCQSICEEKCGSGCDECIAYDPWLGQDKSRYEELVYAWPCFGAITYYPDGKCQGKWSKGELCARVVSLQYYEWQCNN